MRKEGPTMLVVWLECALIQPVILLVFLLMFIGCEWLYDFGVVNVFGSVGCDSNSNEIYVKIRLLYWRLLRWERENLYTLQRLTVVWDLGWEDVSTFLRSLSVPMKYKRLSLRLFYLRLFRWFWREVVKPTDMGNMRTNISRRQADSLRSGVVLWCCGMVTNTSRSLSDFITHESQQ